jgi:hypothetical protein
MHKQSTATDITKQSDTELINQCTPSMVLEYTHGTTHVPTVYNPNRLAILTGKVGGTIVKQKHQGKHIQNNLRQHKLQLPYSPTNKKPISTTTTYDLAHKYQANNNYMQ